MADGGGGEHILARGGGGRGGEVEDVAAGERERAGDGAGDLGARCGGDGQGMMRA